MSDFVANGVVVPELNGHLVVNGSEIHQIVANGSVVWNQTLFNANWSGSTRYLSTAGGYFGIEASGSQFRINFDGYGAGAWITANIDGTFTGNSYVNVGSATFGIETSGSSIRIYENYPSLTSAPSSWITFNVLDLAFSGSTTETLVAKHWLEVSGQSIRWRRNSIYEASAGAWATLT